MTAIKITARGPQKFELQEAVEKFLISAYSAIVSREGMDDSKVTYRLPLRLNGFRFATLLDGLLDVLCDYGPDNFYSSVSISCGTLTFREINFGFGRMPDEQLEWKDHCNEKYCN